MGERRTTVLVLVLVHIRNLAVLEYGLHAIRVMYSHRGTALAQPQSSHSGAISRTPV
jgi:predicted DNA repair protein MutK